MYLDHFGLKEAPFRITPHTEFFFDGAKRGATLDGLIYAIAHDEGIVKVTGEVGSGKTMLCRVLLERMPEKVQVIYLANPSLSRDEILHVLAADLGVTSEGERTTIILRALQERLIHLYGEGKRVVVLIDEAHAMPLETLEEIRLLSNLESNRHKLLQIVLFGQPELDTHLALPHMRQLRERITHSFELGPLVRDDIEQYIDFRLRAAGYRGPRLFDVEALKLLARASQGLTRRINILADKALLAAFAAGTHAIGATQMRAAVKDAGYSSAPLRWRPWAAGAAALAAGIAIGFFGREPRTAAPTPPDPPVAASPAATAPEAAPPAGPVVPPDQPGLPKAGPLTQQRFTATQEWLHAAAPNHYTIQLLTAADSPALEAFLEAAARQTDPQALHVYLMKSKGELQYGVAYGLYATAEESVAAIAGLPSMLKARGPYSRSIASLRGQARQ
jgi:MSHA biogenesis protein MshM